MAWRRNQVNEYSLSDNEKEFVWMIDYTDYKHREKKMTIYAKNHGQMVQLFRKYEGPYASILAERKIPIKEYKEMKL